MSEYDEVITETPAEEVAETAEATTTTAEATDPFEAAAATLGVDVDYLKENAGKLKDLNKFYSELNRKSMELAAQKKQAPAKTAAPESDDADDEIVLDAKSRKALRKVMEEEFGDFFSLVQNTTVDAVGSVIEDFSKSHDDADPTRISEVMDELGLWTPVPSQLKKNMEKAYKLVKAESTDVDAIAEAKAQEMFEKMLADKGLTADDVVSVKKSPRVENISTKDWRDEELTTRERYELLQAKLRLKV